MKDKWEQKYITKCKSCYKEHYNTHKEKIKESSRKYAEEHREYYAEYRKTHKKYNYDQNNRKPRGPRLTLTPEEELIRKKEKTRKNTIRKQIRFETDPEYRKKVTARKTKYVSDRKKKDPIYALTCNLRYKMRLYFKWYSTEGKQLTCAKYGISVKDIVSHVGPRSGDDYDLDHIIPVTAFNWDYPDDIIMANNPHNFRWLNKKENNNKSDFILFDLIKSDPILLDIATKIGIKEEHNGLRLINIKLVRVP